MLTHIRNFVEAWIMIVKLIELRKRERKKIKIELKMEVNYIVVKT